MAAWSKDATASHRVAQCYRVPQGRPALMLNGQYRNRTAAAVVSGLEALKLTCDPMNKDVFRKYPLAVCLGSF